MRNRMQGLVTVVILALGGTAIGADEPRLAEYFGFLPLEIYKLDQRISNLTVADLDGDKADDIIAVNNGRSRIDLLLTTKGDSEDRGKTEANQVISDRRMRLKTLAVNKEIVSLQAGDFNGDGKTDLAFYGTPAELIVLFNQGGAKFSAPKRFTTGDAVESASALAVGDIDRDGKHDLALLTSSDVVIVTQKGGKLGEPERLPHTAANPRMLKLVDLDGDGGDDLVIYDGTPEDPIRVRFSTEGGKLGPEQRFSLEPLRAMAFGEVDGKKGQELLTIEAATGRAKVFTLGEADEDEADRRGRLIFYPLPKGDARGRTIAVGDLDGDGKADVVATDPADAEFLVYLQGKTGLGTGQTFPGLAGGKTVFAADLDGDKKAEVIVLSESEKQIGLTRLDNGRLTFPTPLPISGDPVALAVADLDGDGTPEILYATPGKDGKDDSFALKGLKREKSGSFVPFRWGQEDSVAVKGLSGKPPALRVLDVNKDGQPDILVFNAYGPPVLLLGRPGGEPPAPAAGTLGPLVGATPAGLTVANLGGPSLLVAQGTFARNVALDKNGQWQIKEQFNSGKTSSQILGAAALELDGDGTPEIVLLDKASKSLLFLDKKAGGVYSAGGSLNVGPIDFQGMHVADFDGDGKDDLLIAGTDKFGVMITGRKGQKFKLLASYEPTRKDARLGDLVVGDLNGDKQTDIVLTDLNDHLIDILTHPGGADLDRALTFKVFEKKSFRDRDSLIEPRDLVLGDVDGDKRTDLILMVHDRILVYRQDSGEKMEKTAEKK
ncbi:MAG: repeat protein [Planctomycetota bacterium]|nr:repeat protein [Planctomycetota bacterium]